MTAIARDPASAGGYAKGGGDGVSRVAPRDRPESVVPRLRCGGRSYLRRPSRDELSRGSRRISAMNNEKS
jgi:hypothetical protein